MLAAGTMLGPYKILGPLGAGGMGEVYRARDTRLGRDVAIKVLPPHLAEAPEVRARFEREARSISQLSHPHICTLHDVGHQDGIDYLVMELLEGESLAHRLEKGPLPTADVLALGRQIAEALDSAHRAGVVHRDLKPGNIMLTKSGAKLVDFGLARPQAPGPVPAMSQSPTVRGPITAEGTIVGTFQYMAPEQLEGKPADARSDLWALGCVLYEMATGARAFTAESQASLIAAIFHEEPRAMTELRPVTPVALERVVRACLAKDPDRRVQTAHDLALQLQWIAEAGSAVEAPASAAGRRARAPRLAVAMAIAALIALAGGWALRGAFAPGEHAVRRLSIVAPPDLVVSEMRFAGDGRALHASAHPANATAGSAQALWRRALDRYEWTRIPGTEGAQDWEDTRDGRWIYVIKPVAEGSRQLELQRIPTDGTSPATRVVSLSDAYESWRMLPDGRVVVLEAGRKRFSILAPGASGAPQWLALHCDRELAELHLVQALTDGRTVLAWGSSYQATGWAESCWALDVERGTLTLLEENASEPSLLHGDRLLMTRGATLLAARWDAQGRRLASRPIAVLAGLRTDQPWLNAHFTVSPAGDLGYVPGGITARQRSLAVLHPDGRLEPWNDAHSDFVRSPSSSPDERFALAADTPPGVGTWQVVMLPRGPAGARRVASVEGEDCFDASVAPNGRELVWIRMGRDSTAGLWLAPIDGDAPARRIHAAHGLFGEELPAWYPDGHSILASPVAEGGHRVLLRLTLGADTAKVSEVVRQAFDVGPGSISPDGRRIAYVSKENGEEYIVAAALRPDGHAGEAVAVSRAPGVHPVWADNTTLLWGTRDRQVLGATISTSLAVSEPTKRFDLAPWVREPDNFVPLAGGSLLIIRKGDGEGEIRQFDVVLDFRAELEQAMRKAQEAGR